MDIVESKNMRERIMSLTGEFLRLVLALLVCVLIYLIFVGFAAALECKERPDGKSYWTYRLIDGQRCWYRGHRVLPKSSLHWPDDEPKKIKGDPIFNKIRAEENVELKDVTWNMRRPFDERQPIYPPLLYNLKDIPEPECCWPDLSEFDRRFVGLQP
jgi:hypothetical protein